MLAPTEPVEKAVGVAEVAPDKEVFFALMGPVPVVAEVEEEARAEVQDQVEEGEEVPFLCIYLTMD